MKLAQSTNLFGEVPFPTGDFELGPKDKFGIQFIFSGSSHESSQFVQKRTGA